MVLLTITKSPGSYKKFQGRNPWNIFVVILVQTMTPKRHFKINWSLEFHFSFYFFSNPALKSALHCAIIIFTGYFYWSRISFCYINDIFLFLSCCRGGKEIRFCDWWLVLWEKTEEKKHGSLSIRSSSLTAKVIASLEMSGKRKLN